MDVDEGHKVDTGVVVLRERLITYTERDRGTPTVVDGGSTVDFCADADAKVDVNATNLQVRTKRGCGAIGGGHSEFFACVVI